MAGYTASSSKTPQKEAQASGGRFVDDYDLYLMKLADKNKALKHLHQKDRQQSELETREQGFSIYVNGANSKSLSLSKQQQQPAAELQRKPKTADPRQCERTPDLAAIRKSHSRRKGWGQSSIAVKTEGGDPLHIEVPAILTGEYKEDFENDVSNTEDVQDNTIDSDSIEEEEEKQDGDDESDVKLSLDKQSSLLVFQSQPTSLPSANNNSVATRTLSAVSRKPLSLSSPLDEDSLNDEEDEKLIEALLAENELALGVDNELRGVASGENVEHMSSVCAEQNDSFSDHIKDSFSDHTKDSFSDHTKDSFSDHTKNSFSDHTKDSFSDQIKDSFSGTTSVSDKTLTQSLHDSDVKLESHRVELDDSLDSDNTTLQEVTEKVKGMDSRMQKQLLEIIKDMTALPSISHPNPLPIRDHSLPPTDLSLPATNTSLPSQESRKQQPDQLYLPSPAIGRSVSEQLPLHVAPVSPSQPHWLNVTLATKQPHSSPCSPVSSPASRRAVSSRTTGLRGLLLSQQLQQQQDHHQQQEQLLEWSTIRSSSDTNLDTISHSQRLQTAVLAKGRRQIQHGTEVRLVPSAEETIDDGSSTSLTFYSMPAAVEQRSMSPLALPEDCNNLRGSIQQFDRQRHWKESSLTDQDDILETFLTEHRSRQRQLNSSSEEDLPLSASPIEEETPSLFEIPILPSGQELVLSIRSTWGDRYYVGLTGIEIFTSSGESAPIAQISADPPDINVLPEYSDDPRVVSNVLDGFNETRDDLHMWLTPFLPYQNHHVKILFKEPISLAMIRIWNYNKSRIHSYRGVKDVQLLLDGRKIFEGEICRATGGLGGDIANNAETILFTVDEDILARVASHDCIYLKHVKGPAVGEEEEEEEKEERPSTANTVQVLEDLEERPSTTISTKSLTVSDTKWNEITGKEILFMILSSWGNSSRVGLTEVQLLDSLLSPISLSPSQLTLDSDKRDSDNGCSVVANLVNGVTMTTDPSHMWCTSIESNRVILRVRLDTPLKLGGVRIWNYNKEVYTGVKLMTVHVDDQLVSPPAGFLLRRGPGNDHYDYGQLIQLMPHPHSHAPNDFPSTLPCGFVYQFQLLSSWGDPYYIGLTEIQAKDERDNVVPLAPSNIAAYPDSVNVLDGIINDVRTPDKLIDGTVDCHESHHMWLSPILPGIYNTVYLIFDQPKILSSISMWNYGKTPTRGVKEFSILVDDLLIHTGIVPIAPSPTSGILPTVAPPIAAHVVHLDTSNTTEDKHEVQYQEDGLVISNQPVVIKGAGTTTSSSVPRGIRPLTGVNHPTVDRNRFRKR